MSNSREPDAFAILPAAGRSARMGRPKLLLPWEDATVLARVLKTWRASRVRAVALVLHPEDAELASIGAAWGACVVQPDTPPADMKASIGHGVRCLEERWFPCPDDLWLVAPADMPLLRTSAIDRLIETAAATPEPRPILVPTHLGKRGHPIALPWRLADEIAMLKEQESLKTLLSRERSIEFEIDDASVLADMDTPDDYRRQRPGGDLG